MEELLDAMKREAEELRLQAYLEKYGDLKKFEENQKLDNN
jgi:hypothetical protein